MLSRFITETRRDSGGDGSDATFTALVGVGARRTWPSTVIPCAARAARKAPAVNVAGSSTTNEYLRGIERLPIQPVAVTRPSVVLRTTTLPPVAPGTVRTLLVSWYAVVAGSRTTRAGPRPSAG